MQRRFPEAEAMLLEAIGRMSARWPRGHSHLSWARRHLGALYQAWGKPERASIR
ncbi:MAG: hypothetical protein ACREL9_03810 [Gemmatimonadales bacterium]